jgi:hypothetical protein
MAQTVVAVLVALAACAVVIAKVDNIIHEVRFAEVYRFAPAKLPPAPNAASLLEPHDQAPPLATLPRLTALRAQRQPEFL